MNLESVGTLKAILPSPVCPIESPVKPLGEPGIHSYHWQFPEYGYVQGQGPVHVVRQNYIRLGLSELNLPARVPRFQGPLTREQQKVLVGLWFPVVFKWFVLFCFFNFVLFWFGGGVFVLWPRVWLYRTYISWLEHACSYVHVCACKALL